MSDFQFASQFEPGIAVEERVAVNPRILPPYHVVLLDDDDHTFEYVIHMLQSLFGLPPEKGRQHAEEVNAQGRSIVCTTSKERAELKRDQIHGFGPDARISRCRGSMTSVIEPAK